MKTTLYCLLIALALRFAWSQTVITQTANFIDGERVLIIKGKVAGEMKGWLVIEAHNGAQLWRENGFDPSFTRVVCDYKPLFRKLPNGQWEIMFTSEIAEQLP